MKSKRNYWIYTAVLAVLTLGTLAFPAVQAQKGPVFDKCIQDNSGAPWVLLNSETGDGIFDDCNGTHFSGRGVVTRSGCLINYSLDVNGQKLRASLDTCKQSGSATVRDSQTSLVLFKITDSQFKDNTCVCAVSETGVASSLDQ